MLWWCSARALREGVLACNQLSKLSPLLSPLHLQLPAMFQGPGLGFSGHCSESLWGSRPLCTQTSCCLFVSGPDCV